MIKATEAGGLVQSFSSNPYDQIKWVNGFVPKNVFFLIFDQASYTELFMYENASQSYPNFHDLANNGWNFLEAFSPFNHTRQTLSRIWGIKDNPYSETVIDYFNKRGFKTHLIGNYWDYCGELPSAHYCRNFVNEGKYSISELTHSTFKHLEIIPQAKFVYKQLFKKQYDYGQYKLHQNIQEQTMDSLLALLEANMEGKFVGVHFPIPHEPFVFSRQGARSKQEIKDLLSYIENLSDSNKNYHYTSEILNLYRSNLEYSDLVLGRFIDRLKELNLYEDSILIVTGDHSFQHNVNFAYHPQKDPGSWDLIQRIEQSIGKRLPLFYADKILQCHVPLIIKLPKQEKAEQVTKLISSSRFFSSSNNYLFNSETIMFDKTRLLELPLSSILVPPGFDSVNAPKPKKIQFWRTLKKLTSFESYS